MSEMIVLIGATTLFAVFILFFLMMRMVLRCGRNRGGDTSAGVTGDGGSFGSWHDHGDSGDSGSGGDGGGGGD